MPNRTSPSISDMNSSSGARQLRLEQEVSGYRRRAVFAVQAAFLLGALAVLIHSIAHPFEFETIGLLVSVAMSSAALGLVIRDKLQWAAWLSAFQFVSVPAYLALTSLGTFDSAMLLFPVGLISLAILVRPLKMAIVSGLTMLVGVFIAVATLRGAIGNPALQALVEANPIDVIVSVVVISFSGAVATYVSHIFQGMLRSLADYQATLEANIAKQASDLDGSNAQLAISQAKFAQARAQLLRGEKLAGLETLVAGVAHEINTPISNAALTANALRHHMTELVDLIDRGAVRKSEIKRLVGQLDEAAEVVVRATGRAADLVASFKKVAVDQSSGRRRLFLLDEVTQDVLATLKPSFGEKRIRIECDIESQLQFNGYPGPLSQVLTNLVQNAAIHGLRGGDGGLIRVVARKVAENSVEIRVSDDGVGMSDETVSRIFEPFFTTQPDRGGSGLGLFLVQELVTGTLGGKIQVISKPGAGSEFLLRLPLESPVAALSAIDELAQ